MLFSPKFREKLNKKLNSSREKYIGTEVLLLACLMNESMIGFFGFFVLIFAPVPLKVYGIIGIFTITDLAICSIIFGFVAFLKRLTEKMYERYGIGEYDQCECDALIGFGTIFVFSIVPRLLVYFLEPSYYLWNYPAIIHPFICIIFYIFFLPDLGVTYELNPKTHRILIGGFVVFHILLIIATIRIGAFYPEDKKKVMIIASQVWFGAFSASSCIEFLTVLNGGLVPMKENRGIIGTVNVVKPSVVVPVEEERKSGPKIECKICLLEYSSTLIPRILIECGHTVCEKCADNLLKQNQGKLLSCPFCQAVTVLNGKPARNLPSNRAVLDAIKKK